MSERVWGIASYVLIGTAATIAGGYIAWRCGVEGSTIAAWVQALGSIAAIAVAVYVPWRQRADALIVQHQREWQDRADSLAQLLLIADEVYKYAVIVIQDARPDPAGIKLAQAHSSLANLLRERLMTFQDRTTLQVSAALAYELRNGVDGLLALRNGFDDYRFEPGPSDSDPLGVIKASQKLVGTVEHVRKFQVEASNEARAIRDKLAK